MADRNRPTRAEGDEGFLSRWSRRKAEARSAPVAAPPAASEDPGPAVEAAPSPVQAPASGQEAHEPDALSPVDPKDLPDIETLDASSDFTLFMRPGVPAHLRSLALRKLWRSDPIFSKLDGMVEYGEDYTIASWPKGAIKTAYRIGRGFVKELEKLEGDRAEPPADRAAAEPAPAATRPAAALAEPPQPGPAAAASDEVRPAPQPAPRSASAEGARKPRARPLPRRG
jgi:hypothetical protein